MGFEPTEACTSPPFQDGAFDHSANSPCPFIFYLILRNCQMKFKKIRKNDNSSEVKKRKHISKTLHFILDFSFDSSYY